MSWNNQKLADQTCLRNGCDNVFTPYRRGAVYCSVACSSEVHRMILKDERKQYQETKKNRMPIPKKYLTRGRISGVDY